MKGFVFFGLKLEAPGFIFGVPVLGAVVDAPGGALLVILGVKLYADVFIVD